MQWCACDHAERTQFGVTPAEYLNRPTHALTFLEPHSALVSLIRPPSEYTLNVTGWPAASGVWFQMYLLFKVSFTPAALELCAALFFQPAI